MARTSVHSTFSTSLLLVSMKAVNVWGWILGIQGWEDTTGDLKAETLKCLGASAARWLLKSLSFW